MKRGAPLLQPSTACRINSCTSQQTSSCPWWTLSHLSTEDAVQRATKIAAADTLRPYDLADGPLIRPRLIRIAEDDHRLYLGMHHLVFDGATLHRVVFPELTALYRSYATGVPSSLPDPQAQYTDYTIWELDWVRGPEVAARIANWRKSACRHHTDPAAARSPATTASDLCRRDDPADD